MLIGHEDIIFCGVSFVKLSFENFLPFFLLGCLFKKNISVGCVMRVCLHLYSLHYVVLC